MADFEGDVGDAHHFAAMRIDDLLVQQVAHKAQHVFIGVVGSELLVLEPDAVQIEPADLIVADGEPGPPAAHQEAVDADRVHQRHDSRVADDTQPRPLRS